MKYPTICAECYHFICASDIWYDQYCGAVQNKLKLDYVTGKTVYVDGQVHPYARDINTDGKCEMYKTKVI